MMNFNIINKVNPLLHEYHVLNDSSGAACRTATNTIMGTLNNKSREVSV